MRYHLSREKPSYERVDVKRGASDLLTNLSTAERGCLCFALALMLTSGSLVGCGHGSNAGPSVVASPQYAGRGADVIYQLLPSLKGMRVATVDDKRPLCFVFFCTTEPIADVMTSIRSDLASVGAREGTAEDGVQLFSVSNPPLGYRDFGVWVYEGDKATLLSGGEKTSIRVMVAYR